MKKIYRILDFIIIGFSIFVIQKKYREIETLRNKVQNAINMYKTVYQWINVKLDQEKIENYFLDRGFCKVAVYGMGDLGNLFLRELQKSGNVKIIYGIDKNAGAIISEIPIVKPECVDNESDVVVVTILEEFETIKSSLTLYTNAKIISLEDVVYNL